MSDFNRNLSLLTDYYQLTMMNGFYEKGRTKDIATFDLFFRQKGQINYAVYAGLKQAIEYLENLHFTDSDLEFLRKQNIFSEGFLEYLKNFHFSSR